MTDLRRLDPGVRARGTGLQTYQWPGNATRTPTPSNASAEGGNATVAVAPGREVVVERGPRWLAELAFQPPGWIDSALAVVVVVVLAWAAVGAWRHGEFDPALRRDLVRNGTTVVAAFGLGAAARGLDAPWWLLVLVVGGGAWGVSNAVVRVADRVDGSAGPEGAP